MHALILAAATDAPSVVPADPGAEVAEETNALLEAALASIPRIGLAIVAFVLLVALAMLVRRTLRSRLTKARNESFGNVFSKLAFALIVLVAALLAVTIVFPTIAPGDLVASLGVFSIAIGFAFQDILSNLLAGILLLLRQPFEIGDQIEASGHTGSVERITIRETQLRTFDGQKIIIPNAEVYQETIRVQTAYGPKRTAIAIGLDDHEDQDVATDVLMTAVTGVEGVLSEPAPQVFFTGYGDSTTNLDVRYWTEPEQATVRSVQDRVVRAMSRALKDNGIDMPSPIRELDARPSLEQAMAPERAS